MYFSSSRTIQQSQLNLIILILCLASASAVAQAQTSPFIGPLDDSATETDSRGASPFPGTRTGSSTETTAGSTMIDVMPEEDALEVEETPDPRDFEIFGTAPTSLEICVPSACDIYSPWIDSTLTINVSDEDKSRLLEWSSPDSGATEVLWQVARFPFSDTFRSRPVGLIASARTAGDEEGTFELDFDALEERSSYSLERTPDRTSGLARDFGPDIGYLDFDSHGLRETDLRDSVEIDDGVDIHDVVDTRPRIYYVRATPFDGDYRAGSPSNTIIVVVEEPRDENPLHVPDPPESLYRVDILDFEPIIPATVDRGCVYILGFDRAVLEANHGTAAADFYEAFYQPYIDNSSWHYCPEYGHSNGSWLSQMWDALVSIASYPSELYDAIKEEFIDIIVNAWNDTVGSWDALNCGETCRAGIAVGVDVGLTAMGLPPSLPNAQELIDDGIDYLVAEAIEYSGIAACDQTCRDVIASTIYELAENYANQTAHILNPQIPVGVLAEPVPGSFVRPAEVQLEVRREFVMPPIEEDDDPQVLVTFWATNDSYVGERVSGSFTQCFYDYGSYDCDHWSTEITEPLVAPLFVPISIPVPHIAPGESVVISFPLSPTSYWFPGHEEDITETGLMLPRWDDWAHLYMNAELDIHASISCRNTSMSPHDPVRTTCGNFDTENTVLPNIGARSE